jgi:hypothetical protein
VVGADGNLWFTANHARGVAGMSLAGVFLAFYETPTPMSLPMGITLDPDGNLGDRPQDIVPMETTGHRSARAGHLTAGHRSG